jgi:peptidoglycan glycosyltransferase
MTAAAERLGFNEVFRSDNRMPLAISRYPREPRDPLELGWAGIGQHTTLANPAHMMVLLGAIANEGRGIAPVLTRNESGLPWQTARTAFRIDAAIANRLNAMMFADVDSYDPGRRRTGDLRLGGKTGTAQVDNGRPHAWFVGAAQNPQKPYAIVVVVENGGSGLGVAFEVAVRVLRAIG